MGEKVIVDPDLLHGSRYQEIPARFLLACAAMPNKNSALLPALHRFPEWKLIRAAFIVLRKSNVDVLFDNQFLILGVFD